MRNSILLGATLVVALSTIGFSMGCSQQVGKPETLQYEDGTYRGAFISGDVVEVNLQFTIQNGVVTAARFRHLKHGDYYLETEQEPYRSVVDQHREILDYLIGKNLGKHLADLYHPENLIITQVDGYSGATLRSGKIISAIRDGLNRGVYSY